LLEFVQTKHAHKKDRPKIQPKAKIPANNRDSTSQE